MGTASSASDSGTAAQRFWTGRWVILIFVFFLPFIHQNNTIELIMVQIGCVGGEIWWIDSEKWCPRRAKLDIGPLAGYNQAQVLSTTYLWVLT